MDTMGIEADDAYNRAIVTILRNRKDELRPISYEMIAAKAGISVRTVNRLFSNERDFKLGQFIAIARALQMDPGDVVAQAAAVIAEKSE